MAASNDAEPSVDLATAMSEPSPTNTSGTANAGAASTDEPASSITVNTKTPANFPPPKTDKPRPHVCTTCQRSFARLEHLKRHERSHTKEKPFECPECSRCFARRDLLLRHQQKLHQTTTPASRPRNRRESASGAVPAGSRARKNSVASTSVSGVGSAGGAMRPRANTISHVDGAAMSMIAAANASVARGLAPAHHSRHPSLAGLSMHHGHGHGHGHGLEPTFAGMASAMVHRGVSHGLPKLETHHGMGGFDPYGNGLRTAPPIAAYQNEFDFEGMLFGPGSTINPNALHYSDSPQSMALDPTSPFTHGLTDLTPGPPMDDGFEWLTGFEQQMSFNNPPENAVDGSSPSAISTASQSGISDVMLDGSMMDGPTHPVTTSAFFTPSVMGPPQLTNPFGFDLTTGFPDLLSGAPISPPPPSSQQQMHQSHQQPQQQQKGPMGNPEAYFSTPPPSLSSLSPTMLSGVNGSQNMNHALNYAGAGPETPSSINGINNHGSSPVSSITDSTRNAILGALSCAASQYPFGGRKYSFGGGGVPNSAPLSSPLSAAGAASVSGSASVSEPPLPSAQDLKRYVGAYIRYFHPHLPFLHIPTLSFEPNASSTGGGNGGSPNPVGGSGCLILSMAAIGALYEMEREQSGHLFEMAKKMIQLYLDERRKANVRKADFRRLPVVETGGGQAAENTVETPVWLVQAMLLNVVYGHNCGEKRAGEIASTHAAALVSLAQGAELLRPARIEPTVQMEGIEDSFGDTPSQSESELHAEWLGWKSMEERKRTLYIIFILSSMLVSAYNQSPALTNSEILLDLPCDEEFFAAESAAAFQAKGGVAAANHNRIRFHDALGELLRAHEKPQFRAVNTPHQSFGAAVGSGEIPESDLKPSTLGCLILINALHNYVWETRQRHHTRVWTNEETEKLHRHMEPALRAWQAAWVADPHHSLERPNPFGAGPLSADAVPLMDVLYVRLFVNMSRTKEKFWQRDWDGLAEELARGTEIVQHAEHSPASNAESATTDPSDMSVHSSSSVFIDSPPTQSSSPEFPPPQMKAESPPRQVSFQQPQSQGAASRRERHLRKAAFYAADSLSISDRLGVTFADLTSRELPLQSAMCAFDCSQVLAEWVATLQDRLGRYMGVLGRDNPDPASYALLLDDEDRGLLGKIEEILTAADAKMSLDAAGEGAGASVLGPSAAGEQGGFAAKILRVTAYTLGKAAVWPVVHLMATCLEHHAGHMRARAEKSLIGRD